MGRDLTGIVRIRIAVEQCLDDTNVCGGYERLVPIAGSSCGSRVPWSPCLFALLFWYASRQKARGLIRRRARGWFLDSDFGQVVLQQRLRDGYDAAFERMFSRCQALGPMNVSLAEIMLGLSIDGVLGGEVTEAFLFQTRSRTACLGRSRSRSHWGWCWWRFGVVIGVVRG